MYIRTYQPINTPHTLSPSILLLTCLSLCSQPDISPSDTLDFSHQNPGTHSGGTDRDFDTLFDAAQHRNSSHIEYLENGERSLSDPSIVQENVLGRSRSEEKESEVDSGIAVVEHSVSTSFS